jgi:hypothetical protein
MKETEQSVWSLNQCRSCRGLCPNAQSLQVSDGDWSIPIDAQGDVVLVRQDRSDGHNVNSIGRGAACVEVCSWFV